VEKRKEFVEQWLSGEFSMTELCAFHQISRQCGYETVARYMREGGLGLEESSRAPLRHPNQTPAEIQQRILALRQAHMRWGPRKLKTVLEREDEFRYPAASTIGELLRREGLVIARKKRRRVPPYTAPFAAATESNRVWCADFKGWRRTTQGERIDPLTITDACTRYLLRCHAVEKTDGERVQSVFEAAFREYGMPLAIRTDNGAPFASRAIAGLSRLSVWWMKLGIVPERIEAGHPEQNGRHERMHRTLEQETMSPMAATRKAQQRRFDEFRREFNEVRPHEALGMQTPASCYTLSPRPFPARVREPEYGSSQRVRKVHLRGQFWWKYEEVFLTETLIGERIGLEPIDERWYSVYFAQFPIACFDSYKRKVLQLKDFDKDKAGEGEKTPSPAPHPQQPDQKLSPMCPV
jgi:putative transposase